VRFVGFHAGGRRLQPTLPLTLPATERWLVRVLASTDRCVFGEYRRRMKTIGCLGQLDALFGARLTTRSWSTVAKILDVLNRPMGDRD